MIPLTAEQGVLVATYYEETAIVANLFHTHHLDRDERRSYACEGLCHAARTWREGGEATFRTYAWRCMCRIVRRKIGHAARKARNMDVCIKDYPLRCRRDDSCPWRRRCDDFAEASGLAVADVADFVRGSYDGILTSREMQIMRMYDRGLTKAEIGIALDATQDAVSSVRYKAVRKLRASLAGEDI